MKLVLFSTGRPEEPIFSPLGQFSTPLFVHLEFEREISRDKTVSIRNTRTGLGSLSPGDPNKVSIVSEVSTFFQWFLISRFYYALV